MKLLHKFTFNVIWHELGKIRRNLLTYGRITLRDATIYFKRLASFIDEDMSIWILIQFLLVQTTC